MGLTADGEAMSDNSKIDTTPFFTWGGDAELISGGEQLLRAFAQEWAKGTLLDARGDGPVTSSEVLVAASILWNCDDPYENDHSQGPWSMRARRVTVAAALLPATIDQVERWV